jgi:hypothetical protein
MRLNYTLAIKNDLSLITIFVFSQPFKNIVLEFNKSKHKRKKNLAHFKLNCSRSLSASQLKVRKKGVKEPHFEGEKGKTGWLFKQMSLHEVGLSNICQT